MSRRETILTRIRADLDRGSFQDKIPGVRALSSRYRTSPVTMLDVMHSLVDTGVLEQDPDSGRYFVAGTRGRQPSQSLVPRPPRHEEVAELLRAEIVTGRYTRRDNIPHVKELQTRFGCSRETVAAALSRLRDDRLIEPYGRGHRLSSAVAPKRRSSRVYLVGEPGLVHRFHSSLVDAVRAAEQEVSAMGWGEMQYYLTDDFTTTSAPPDHEVAGFLHLHVGMRQPWREFFLKHRKVPVVSIDPNQHGRRIRAHPSHYRVAVDNEAAGSDVGTHLAALGHHRIAFITHMPESEPWVLLRHRGLERALGEEGSVTTVLVEAPESATGPHRALNAEVGKLYAGFRRTSGLPDSYAMEGMAPAYQFVEMVRLKTALGPVFERLAGEPFTAWVCVNDIVALLALAFLRSRRRDPVPSVAGFDNSPLAYREGLTSYDFALSRLGHLAVRTFASPAWVAYDKFHYRAVKGELAVRGSTAPPSGR